MIPALPASTFDWFAYYAQLREYKDNLEQRFQALLFQEGLVAVASVSIVVALDNKLNTLLLGLPIGAVSALVIGVYSFLTSKYFRQVREVGLMMAGIEGERFGFNQKWGIKLRLSHALHIHQRSSPFVVQALQFYPRHHRTGTIRSMPTRS